MWFARLFGGRDDGRDDELPTAVAPLPPPATSVTTTKTAAPAPAKPAKGKGGFDPYNSGAFERRNAWGSVKRRS
ncbi:hypothetical protein HNQ60_001175 [Povalibacter uvarum]|uniref:Uncharacterized protein n=1 Tax=Povalibacter uvarum TaxID=732238 RepID=A0A841HIW5_9GAMM|nr:hypothetical protein [Povalibacter uvarum]MBB6092329.1 hypothetical protein [Povalibacter uvarum]